MLLPFSLASVPYFWLLLDIMHFTSCIANDQLISIKIAEGSSHLPCFLPSLMVFST